MRNSILLFASAAAALLLASAPAHALVVVPITGPPVFDLDHPDGTIAAFIASKTETYNFTFTTSATFDVLMQMQGSLVHPQLLAFSLFSGLPGSGVFVADSR